MNRWLLVLHTLRHLRPGQIGYRALRRVQPMRVRKFGGIVAHSPSQPAMARALEAWVETQPAERVESAGRVVEGRFSFLGHEERLPAIDWQRRYESHLWNYNLHYFDYAVDLAIAWRRTSDARYLHRFEELALGWVKGRLA